MVPSRVASDNRQAVQYQTTVASIGSCGACHDSSRGEGSREFLEEHGGARPEHVTACNVCHTAVASADTTRWPHSFQWRSR
jgi:hypothetical protein